METNRKSRIDLNRKYIKSKYKLLGVTSITRRNLVINSEQGFRRLGKIGSDLEKYVDPVLINSESPDFQKVIHQMESSIAEDKILMENEREFWDSIISIYPSFGKDMKTKVGEEKYALYESQVRKTAEVVRELGKPHIEGVEDAKFETEAKISDLIDSQEFNKACEIEDNFMISEFKEFVRLAEEMDYEADEVKHTTACVNLARLVREAQEVSDKKQEYIGRFSQYEKFLNSLTDKVVIKHGPASFKNSSEAPSTDDTGR